MVATSPQERLKALHAEGQEIQQGGTRDADKSKRFEEILTEMGALRAQVEQDNQFAEQTEWGNRSAGMLPLADAGGANVEGFAQAGHVVLDRLEGGSVRLSEEYGEGGLTPAIRATTTKKAYKDAFHQYLRAGMTRDDPGLRTLQEASDTAGGFMVPTDFLNEVIAKKPTPTRVSGRVRTLTTSRDALAVPRINYTTDDLYTSPVRVTWTGEQPAAATTSRVSDPVFSQSLINIFTAMMSLPLTVDLVEDTSFPLLDYIAGIFKTTIDLLKDNVILNGTGQGQPSGILLNPGDSAKTQPAVVKSGTSATIGTDGTFLTNLEMSVPEQYDENSAWVFNKTNTGNAIAQLQDTTHRPLWNRQADAGLSEGFRSAPLFGYPVLFSGFMPNIGASTYPIIFGDLTGYYLVERVGLSIQILRELYAETNQILVLGRVRFGGQVVEPWKLKVGQCHS